CGGLAGGALPGLGGHARRRRAIRRSGPRHATPLLSTLLRVEGRPRDHVAVRAMSGASPTAEAQLIHLDDGLAVVAKPPGLSLATSRREPAAAAGRLVEALPAAERALLAGRDLHLVHRLDAPTSGLVLLALDADTHRDLSGAIAARRLGKVYLAVVWGRPRPAVGRYTAPLGPDRADRRRM